MNGAPSLYSQLLAEDEDGQVLSRLRIVNVAAAQVPPELVRGLLARGVSTVFNSYALSECTLLTSTDINDDIEIIANTVGKPAPGMQIKLVDENGRAVMHGEEGEIQAKGFSVMSGYYKDDKMTREVLSADGWLRTGDIGRMTSDGNLQIVGRIKDMIIVHGYNVFPAEVEAQLRSSGLLLEAAVVGQASRISGEECVAFIVPRGNPETARRDLLTWARKNMAEFKVPSRLFVRTKLPLNINGKLDREALRRELARVETESVQPE